MRKLLAVPIILTNLAIIICTLTPGWIIFTTENKEVKIWVNAFYSILYANGSFSAVGIGHGITLNILDGTSADPTYTTIITLVTIVMGTLTISVIVGELWHEQMTAGSTWFTQRRLPILLLVFNLLMIVLIGLFGHANNMLSESKRMDPPASLITSAILVVLVFLESLFTLCWGDGERYRRLYTEPINQEESRVM